MVSFEFYSFSLKAPPKTEKYNLELIYIFSFKKTFVKSDILKLSTYIYFYILFKIPISGIFSLGAERLVMIKRYYLFAQYKPDINILPV